MTIIGVYKSTHALTIGRPLTHSFIVNYWLCRLYFCCCSLLPKITCVRLGPARHHKRALAKNIICAKEFHAALQKYTVHKLHVPECISILLSTN